MTIDGVIAKAKNHYLADPTRKINWGSEKEPDWSPFNYVDASEEITKTLDTPQLRQLIDDLFENYSEVELDNFHTHPIGSTVTDTTYVHVMRTLLEAFIAQQLGQDKDVLKETARREQDA